MVGYFFWPPKKLARIFFCDPKFDQKKCQKIILTQHFFPKNLGQKVGRNFFVTSKNLARIFFQTPKNLGQKYFSTKEILSEFFVINPNKFESACFFTHLGNLGQNFFWPNKVWVRISFWPKIIWVGNLWSYMICLCYCFVSAAHCWTEQQHRVCVGGEVGWWISCGNCV